MQVLDENNRHNSLNPLVSVCVTAPAGSGKTELLIQRILVLLSRVNKPEEILAITFTRKAAAEMHQRIVAALELADSSDEPCEDHKKMTWSLARNALSRNEECGWHLLDNPNRLKIQTIDGFCASLTRQMPILSKFGSQPQICDAPEKYYRLTAQNFLAGLESNGKIAEHLMLLLSHLDNDMGRVEQLLVSLLERRDQWLVHIVFAGFEKQVKAGLEATCQTVISKTLQTVHGLLQAMAGELLPLLDYAGSNLQESHPDSTAAQLAGIKDLPTADSQLLPTWLAITELFLTTQNTWRKTVNVNNGFPSQTRDGDKVLAKQLKSKFSDLISELSNNTVALDALTGLRHLPAAQYSSSQWHLLEALTVLLPALTAELQTVFQQKGEVDYIQVAIAALQSLGGERSPSELLLKLDYQLQHILIDEFQDTSSSQFDLLKRLVDGWVEHNENNPAAPKTLFIVGDGMQSIYAFRAANVGLFLEARKYGVNHLTLEDLPLSVNFRSTSEIVSWINDVFSTAFPASENISRGAVKYEPSSAFKGSIDNSAVSIKGFTSPDASLSEASYIAQVISEELESDPAQKIAILIRSRNHLRDIIPALKEAGIDWCANEIDPLAQYSFISDLLILTRALANLQDKVAWAALLRTPYCGLNNSDLHALLGSDYISVWHAIAHYEDKPLLSKFARQKLGLIRPLLQQALDERLRKPFRVALEGVWLRLGGASLIGNIENFDHIDDYFDLLENFENEASLKEFDQFEASVNKLFAAAKNIANVHLMTIHKAKGLEFDTVIVPGLARNTRSNSKNLLMWREYLSTNHSGLIMAPITATGDDEDDTYKHLYYEQGIASALENTRLLYVACTRSISRLHLSFCLDDEDKTPPKNSLLHSIWPCVQADIQWSNESPVNSEQLGLDFDTTTEHTNPLQRVSSSWQPPRWSFPNPLEDYYLTVDYSPENTLPLPIIKQPARIIGTVVHSILERLVNTGSDYWMSLNTEFRLHWVNSLLQSQGLFSENSTDHAGEVIRHIDNTVADTRGCWILSNDFSYSKCELALISTDVNVSRKIIDRCFATDSGEFWIIDYKTGQPDTGETQQGYIAREVANYTPQLQAYKLFIQNHHELKRYNNIRLALYFTHFPLFEEIV